VCPNDGTAPDSASATSTPSGPRTPGTSGAIVIETRCPRAARAISRTTSARPCVIRAGFCAPQRAADRNGPSTWMPASSPPSARSASRAVRSSRVARSAVTSEATRDVVPCRRCSAMATATVLASVASGKLPPPPPWQCRSTRPGSRVRGAASGAGSGVPGGASVAGPTQLSRSPVTTTTPSSSIPDGVTTRPRRTVAPVAGAAPGPADDPIRLTAVLSVDGPSMVLLPQVSQGRRGPSRRGRVGPRCRRSCVGAGRTGPVPPFHPRRRPCGPSLIRNGADDPWVMRK